MSNSTADSVSKKDSVDNKLPKFDKLVVGGDFYSWINSVELHFMALDLWDLASEKQESYPDEDGRKIARCKRDIMFVLSKELQNVVRHKKFPYQMLATLKKFFVGGKIAEYSILVQRISRIRFDGDFFRFLADYQSAVTQLW